MGPVRKIFDEGRRTAIARTTDFEKERKKYTRRKTIKRLLAVILLTAAGVILYAMRFEIASQGFGVLL